MKGYLIVRWRFWHGFLVIPRTGGLMEESVASGAIRDRLNLACRPAAVRLKAVRLKAVRLIRIECLHSAVLFKDSLEAVVFVNH